jgi:hypothetical protein
MAKRPDGAIMTLSISGIPARDGVSIVRIGFRLITLSRRGMAITIATIIGMIEAGGRVIMPTGCITIIPIGSRI